MVGTLLCVVILTVLDHIGSNFSDAEGSPTSSPPLLVVSEPTATGPDQRCLGGGGGGGDQHTTIRPKNPSLRAVVPPGYDQYARPTNKDGSPLTVSISAKVRDIQKIDEQNMDVTIEWYLRFYWQDSRLNAPSHLEDGAWLNIAPEITQYIWLPTTYIDHVKEVTKTTLLVQPESLRMQNNGLIRYSISVTTRTSCSMDFSAYPFDNQVCYFTMESYQFTSKEISYKWYNREIEQSDDIRSGHFDFKLYSVDQQNVSHSTRTYPAVMVGVALSRRISYHLMTTFLPSGLFVCVSWLTLLVPLDQVPGRMVLTITTLLTLVSMFAAVRQESPKVSYAKAVDQWMIMCVVYVFCVLFEFTLAIRMHELGRREARRARRASPPPASRLRSGRLLSPPRIRPGDADAAAQPGRESTLTPPSDGSSLPGASRMKQPAWKSREESEREARWTPVSWTVWGERLEVWSLRIFPLVFVLGNLCYWLYWLVLRK